MFVIDACVVNGPDQACDGLSAHLTTKLVSGGFLGLVTESRRGFINRPAHAVDAA